MNPEESTTSDSEHQVPGCEPLNSKEVRATANDLPNSSDEAPAGSPPTNTPKHPRDWKRCSACGEWFGALRAELAKGGGLYCSRRCMGAHRIETGVLRGAGNPRWLGGVSKDAMRYRRRAIAKNPEREAARRAVAYAVKWGHLARQPCEVCGAAKSEAHHHDYSKPLEVRWLCRRHHVDEHKRAA